MFRFPYLCAEIKRRVSSLQCEIEWSRDCNRGEFLVHKLTRYRIIRSAWSLGTIWYNILPLKKSRYNWRSVSLYRSHSETCDQILLSVRRLLSGSCCLVSVGRPLWREVGSVGIMYCPHLYSYTYIMVVMSSSETAINISVSPFIIIKFKCPMI
jgi:hypothetical protein